MRDDKRALTSAGASTAARWAVEDSVNAELQAALARFLRDLQDDARLSARSDALTAGLGIPSFTLGNVAGAWENRVVRGTVRALARAVRVPFPVPPEQMLLGAYMTGAEERLLLSDLPEAAYESATKVLGTAVTEGWGPKRIDAHLRAALDPTSGAATALTPTDPSDLSDLAQEGLSWQSRAARISRTESTAAHGNWMLQAMIDNGMTGKRWVSYHDKHTRPTHLEADGQEVPITAPFIVGGEALLVPGDPHGSPAVTFNCRCVITGV